MGQRVYDFLDLSDKRRIFAVGDIHGCFDALDEKLKEVNFDESQDMLISVGDLVDRGPRSHHAIYYTGKPWFKRVIGNHELMTLDHLQGYSYLHTINGGGWLARMGQEEKQAHVDFLMDAPYLLEVKTPKGMNVGFVHADLRWDNWQQNIDAPDFQTFCWSRQGVNNLRDPDFPSIISGIDKVFFGHNALTKAYSRGNCNWIDTGCGFEDGELTIVDVEEFGTILNLKD